MSLNKELFNSDRKTLHYSKPFITWSLLTVHLDTNKVLNPKLVLHLYICEKQRYT